MIILMKYLIQGKLAIITGSAQGLGKAFAIRLLAAGAKVANATIIIISSSISSQHRIIFIVSTILCMGAGF